MSDEHTKSRRAIPAVLVAAVALIAAAGCGSGSSGSTASKPAYCSDRSALKSSVEGLTIPTSSDDIGQLQSQFATIKSSSTALVNAAKSDFPDETTAIQSSVDTLDSAVNALPSSPTAAQIATIAADASAVVTAVNGFSDATASQCG